MNSLHTVYLIFTLLWALNEGGEDTSIVCNNGTHVIQVINVCNTTQCKLFIYIY